MLVIILAIVLVIAGSIALIGYTISRLKTESAPTPLGGTCALDTDCVGWGPATTASACCNGTCQQKKADWAGIVQQNTVDVQDVLKVLVDHHMVPLLV